MVGGASEGAGSRSTSRTCVGGCAGAGGCVSAGDCVRAGGCAGAGDCIRAGGCASASAGADGEVDAAVGEGVGEERLGVEGGEPVDPSSQR